MACPLQENRSAMILQGIERRTPIGAEVAPGGVHFRVWAPERKRIEVVLESDSTPAKMYPLEREPTGHFSWFVEGAAAGTLYRFRVDGGSPTYPDPASRYQPQGPHGPSEVIDPNQFPWRTTGWQGVGKDGQVLYEMHIGTFTSAGTWDAAIEKLPLLGEIGITLLEVMPLGDFPGAFGWGYDGVNLWAPTRLYGRPDDFRRFVDAAHQVGLGVILDVVYNHVGPDGNYLKEFSPHYFTDRYENEWGEAINFDGAHCEGVREFFIENAAYWIEEFRLDGLRLDATQSIHDASPGEHILAAITRRAREAAGRRGLILVAENEPQDVRLLRARRDGGFEIDAVWNDDFHHSATVALTGRSEAYYMDYRGKPQELVSAAKYGFLFQGQRHCWQKQPRGSPALSIPARSFVCYLQNHDQVANSARGLRIHQLTSPGRIRAMTALLLLGPSTPLLFQGQEFAASSPFLYFADHKPELARAVSAGRREFLSQFPSLGTEEIQRLLPRPDAGDTFERCKLIWSERESHVETVALFRDLLRLRKDDRPFAEQNADALDGAVLGEEAFLLRYLLGGQDDRLLLVNLGPDLRLDPAPEPLLAPPENCSWELLWSSEAPEYGGLGTAIVETDEVWRLPAHAALVFRPVPSTDKRTRIQDRRAGAERRRSKSFRYKPA